MVHPVAGDGVLSPVSPKLHKQDRNWREGYTDIQMDERTEKVIS
jgi:hypothetical protein